MSLKPSTLVLSIIVPVYNEEGNVALVHAKIKSVLQGLNKTFEIIFVDDGSDDHSLEQLQKLSPVTIIVLAGHYGKSYALDAAIKQAQGEMIITMDGDGQNDPEDIPHYLAQLQDGYDMVCGWRYQRRDPLEKRFVSKGAAFLRKLLVKDGVHDAVCGMHAYRRPCFEGLDIYGGLHRMLPAIMRAKGFKITEIKVKHHPRTHGQSKYGWQRILDGFRDMIYIWFWRKNPSQPIRAGRKINYSIKEIIKK